MKNKLIPERSKKVDKILELIGKKQADDQKPDFSKSDGWLVTPADPLTESDDDVFTLFCGPTFEKEGEVVYTRKEYEEYVKKQGLTSKDVITFA